MLAQSPFVLHAVSKPWFTYLVSMCTLLPLHAVGLIFGTTVSMNYLLRRFIQCMRGPNSLHTTAACARGCPSVDMHHRACDLHSVVDSNVVVLLTLWSWGVLGGHTLLSMLGAGTQMRFLLPMLPATSVLAALAIVTPFNVATWSLGPCFSVYTGKSADGFTTQAGGGIRYAVAALLLSYAAMHTLYYGILFAPLYADIEYSLVDAIACLLRNPKHNLATEEVYVSIVRFLRHYGVDLNPH